MRKDFLDIYTFAKKQGFVVSVFTNGGLLNRAALHCFKEFPPYSIELTMNGITPSTYERISRIPGSYKLALNSIGKLTKLRFPLVLKANCLQQNLDEIVKIKHFAEKHIGTHNEGYCFKYDYVIFPRMNGDLLPTRFRLDFNSLSLVRNLDRDMQREFQRAVRCGLSGAGRDSEYLYHCNSWCDQVCISPQGRLKFCVFTEKFSVDLKTNDLSQAFRSMRDNILTATYQTNSPCRHCKLRRFCLICPAKSFLETGNEESPIPFYCEFARRTKMAMPK